MNKGTADKGRKKKERGSLFEAKSKVAPKKKKKKKKKKYIEAGSAQFCICVLFPCNKDMFTFLDHWTAIFKHFLVLD
jgi:hypothetical protein